MNWRFKKPQKQPYSRAKIILKSCILTFKQAYVIEVKKLYSHWKVTFEHVMAQERFIDLVDEVVY